MAGIEAATDLAYVRPPFVSTWYYLPRTAATLHDHKHDKKNEVIWEPVYGTGISVGES
jgi:hypothetical protein